MATEKKRVEFKIKAPEAQSILLSGNFNGWSDNADPMKKDGSGTWRKVKMLPKGSHEYKFIIDGTWVTDPESADTVPNQFGSVNSIRKV